MIHREYHLGDVVQMKKTHPCGTNRWEIIRVGMDIKIKCLGCGRRVMLPRARFDKGVRVVEARTQPQPDEDN